MIVKEGQDGVLRVFEGFHRVQAYKRMVRRNHSNSGSVGVAVAPVVKGTNCHMLKRCCVAARGGSLFGSNSPARMWMRVFYGPRVSVSVSCGSP